MFQKIFAAYGKWLRRQAGLFRPRKPNETASRDRESSINSWPQLVALISVNALYGLENERAEAISEYLLQK